MRKAIHAPAYRKLCLRLRERREELGMRQVELAEKLGVPQSVLSSMEAGGRRVDVYELLQITEALELDLLDLVEQLVESDRVEPA